jgi:hypothetical protein
VENSFSDLHVPLVGPRAIINHDTILTVDLNIENTTPLSPHPYISLKMFGTFRKAGSTKGFGTFPLS